MNDQRASALLIMAGLTLAGTANAAQINVNANIAVDTLWTSNNTYNLTTQIYVLPGATLTIQPGTVIASVPTVNGSGALAITRGAKIVAIGTWNNPIIFTSTNDVATWTGGDPKTGVWREAANEWGNLTIMGNAFVSNGTLSPQFINAAGNPAGVPNTNTCTATNVMAMEGLVASPPLPDPKVLFGGGNDNDDSGTLSYVSLRYGGRVIGLANELNGLSLGGIGRDTDIDHVEIMNNVDDGIEVWGGTVNLKHVSVWNIGDDSIDTDSGWRGKAQFVLIVQGHSIDAGQGGGVGDNCFEMDGAQNSNAQPLTTATIYNSTVIGQPVHGDGGTVWRDGARVQYRQSVFMDLGEKLVRFDNIDGDGNLGYGGTDGGPGGFATLKFQGPGATVWNTAWTATSALNACPSPATTYTAQSAGNAPGQGFLAEITDSVFFRNLTAAYTGDLGGHTGVVFGADGIQDGSDAVGVTVGGGSNAAKSNVVAAYNAGTPDANMPITSLTRQFFIPGMSPPNNTIVRGGLVMAPVISLDPRAANAAVNSVGTPPNDGFFDVVNYRGAFDNSPAGNWLCGWTAADAYGFLIPHPCQDSDVDGNESVGFGDLTALLLAWGPCAGCPEDIDGNNNVGFSDLTALLLAWGPCCHCTGNVSGNVIFPSACCLPNDTCVEFGYLARCTAAGGVFHPGESCATFNCP